MSRVCFLIWAAITGLGPTERIEGASVEIGKGQGTPPLNAANQGKSLTFDVDLHKGRFAHSERVLRGAAVEARRVPGDGAEVDLWVGAEDPVQVLLPPEDGRGRVAVGDALQQGVVLVLLKVVQGGSFNSHAWGI